MVFLGLMMLTGWMNNITGYLSGFGAAPPLLRALPPVPATIRGLPPHHLQNPLQRVLPAFLKSLLRKLLQKSRHLRRISPLTDQFD